MVNQVKLVAIFMIVQGSLAGLMGLLYAVSGPALMALFTLDQRNKTPSPEETLVFQIIMWVYLALGGLILVSGILNVIAGIRCLKFRGRTFAIVALFLNLLSVVTCYCAPTGLATMTFGLIVMFDGKVKQAFAMVADGMPVDQVLAHFDERRPVRYVDSEEDDLGPP